jgi:hypothetical protein
VGHRAVQLAGGSSFRKVGHALLAAIVEGAWVLHAQGKVDTTYSRGLERDVPALLHEAAAIAEKGKVR